MNWGDLLENLVRASDTREFQKAERCIGEIREMIDEPWKTTVMEMIAEAVEKHGLDGIESVRKAFKRMSQGKEPDLSFVNLRTRSDALAIMQNAEANQKKKVNDFLVIVGESLGMILKVVIKGLLKG